MADTVSLTATGTRTSELSELSQLRALLPGNRLNLRILYMGLDSASQNVCNLICRPAMWRDCRRGTGCKRCSAEEQTEENVKRLFVPDQEILSH